MSTRVVLSLALAYAALWSGNWLIHFHDPQNECYPITYYPMFSSSNDRQLISRYVFQIYEHPHEIPKELKLHQMINRSKHVGLGAARRDLLHRIAEWRSAPKAERSDFVPSDLQNYWFQTAQSSLNLESPPSSIALVKLIFDRTRSSSTFLEPIKQKTILVVHRDSDIAESNQWEYQ